jgi:glycosyltransferase involved in cell wall biosynthesis
MSKAEISVLLPVYNDEDTIGDALESVLNQTFDRYEVIVVDDGSTDRSADIVREYTDDASVRMVSHEANQGLPAALNTGLKTAEGKFVARQDADDISCPDRFETQYEYLTANPEVTS